MATDFTEFVALAQELIADNGRPVSLVQMSAAAADPDKPWNGPGTPTELLRVDNVPACFVPPSGSGFGRDIATPEQLARCEQVVLIAPGAQDYSAIGVVVDDGVRWKVQWTTVLKPGPLTVLYAFGVKR